MVCLREPPGLQQREELRVRLLDLVTLGEWRASRLVQPRQDRRMLVIRQVEVMREAALERGVLLLLGSEHGQAVLARERQKTRRIPFAGGVPHRRAA